MQVKDKKCHHCGTTMIIVSMKNPYIDDFTDDCPNEDCEYFGFGLLSLRNSAMANARAEAQMERDWVEDRGEDRDE